MSSRSVGLAAAAAIAVGSLGLAVGRHGDRTGEQVTVTRTVMREAAAPLLQGDGSTLPTALAARARPPAAELAGAWTLSYALPRLVLIYWRLSSGTAAWGTNVLEVWRDAGSGWTRLSARRRPGWIHLDVETGDVTQDGIPRHARDRVERRQRLLR